MQFNFNTAVIQFLQDQLLAEKNIKVAVLRLDLLHPFISGNKWFKLKYNLEEAEKQKKNTILTFGGAWSNHLAATAFACLEKGFKSIGIVRGEKPAILNSTLKNLLQQGMQLQFISRKEYGQQKNNPAYWKKFYPQFDDIFIIPEGGNNENGTRGCEEILKDIDQNNFTHCCCPVGTGATLAGLIRSANINITVIGFTSLKKEKENIENNIAQSLPREKKYAPWQLITDYRFGGFGKFPPALLNFINSFYSQHHIPLDIVYTGKMMFGIFDLTGKNFFNAGSKILIIHTGGLQGNESLQNEF